MEIIVVVVPLLLIGLIWFGISKSRKPRQETGSAGGSRRLGGWAFVVFFLGWVGGLTGYLMLQDQDRPRAKHVLRWGLIWTGIWIAVVVAINVVLVALVYNA